MKEKTINFLKAFLPFALLLFALQYLLINYVFDFEPFYSTFSIYGFHFVATLTIYFVLLYINSAFPENTGFAFIGLGLFKMLAAVLFLVPMLINESSSPFRDVLAFFIPYFLFLAFETFFATKLLRKH